MHTAVSPRLDSLVPSSQRGGVAGIAEREIAIRRIRPTPRTRSAPQRDPVAQDSFTAAASIAPNPGLAFEGIRNADNAAELGVLVVPPDTNGNVGGYQYVQAANLLVQVFNKATGSPLLPLPPATPAPVRISSLFAGFGGPCETTDDGDSIVLYDAVANRWLISQFSETGPPYHQCIAVSQSDDATGAYYVYDFAMPNSKFNDYPKFGVWPDAYYMTDNQFSSPTGSFQGGGVFGFDRAKMLAGDPTASYIYFDLAQLDATIGGMLPADLDGPPPPLGSPGYFAYFTATEFNDAQDALRLFEFHVDFATPANSSFKERSESPLLTAPFNPLLSCGGSGLDCIPQPPPANNNAKLDALSDRLMFRLQYRNFGTHESLVTNHTVDATGASVAGIRYYQLQRPLPAGMFGIGEQATYSPDTTQRWMGSAALDRQGNLAVGYSVSSTSVFPSIRYAGRLASDPPGGLSQGENTLQSGVGAQRSTTSRWGDYSMLTVDPQDGCTFWYTNEYYATSSDRGWQTRIGNFKFPQCTPLATWTPTRTATLTQTGTPSPSASPSSTPSVTATSTRTATSSLTATATLTASHTNPPTTSPLPTDTPTRTPSLTPTNSPTSTSSQTATVTKTPTQTPTLAPSSSPTLTPTGTESPPPSVTPTQTPTPSLTPTAFTVDGQVRYFGTPVPVSGVNVALQGPHPTVTTTDLKGQYAATLAAGVTWQTGPTKVDERTNITAIDASVALQAAVGLVTLTPLQKFACDTSGSGTLTAIDASLILQYRVGLITELPVAQTCASEWLFQPLPAADGDLVITPLQVTSGTCQMGTIAYQPLTQSYAAQDFLAILIGDCNANWQPAAGGGGASGTVPVVRFGRARFRRGRLTIAVSVESSLPRSAIDLDIRYDARAARSLGVRRTAATRDALLAVNRRRPGIVRVALASVTPFDTRWPVLWLRFESRRPMATKRSLHVMSAD